MLLSVSLYNHNSIGINKINARTENTDDADSTFVKQILQSMHCFLIIVIHINNNVAALPNEIYNDPISFGMFSFKIQKALFYYTINISLD